MMIASASALLLAATPYAPPADAAPTTMKGAADAGTASALRSVLDNNATTTSDPASNTVYFGNGCFWGRQKGFVDTEMALGRSMDKVSAVVGYAGGAEGAGSDGKVCYYTSAPSTIYEKLGHAEVVQVGLTPENQKEEFRAFAKQYFKEFQETPMGMIRLDPQDAGAGYRNVIGIPGGLKSDLMEILREENIHNMTLVAGEGNKYESGGGGGMLARMVGAEGVARENDEINKVYIMDSAQFPFYRAEQYHQFHNGIGKAFPADYRVTLKKKAEQRGLIGPTGCPELPF